MSWRHESTNKQRSKGQQRRDDRILSAQFPYAVTSVDGFFSASGSGDETEPVMYAWENKGISGADALVDCDRQIERYGVFCKVTFRRDDSFDTQVTNLAVFGGRKQEVLQLLHHAAVTGRDVLYTVAAAKEGVIKRAVLVSFDEAWRLDHLRTVQFVFSHHAASTFDPAAEIFLDQPNKVNVMQEEFAMHMKMRAMLRAKGMILDHNEILPLICWFWNKSKSAIDAQSKDVAELRLRSSDHGTHRKVFMELLMLCVTGAIRIHRGWCLRQEVKKLKTRDHILQELTALGPKGPLLREALRAFDLRKAQATEVPASQPQFAVAVANHVSDPDFDYANPAYKEMIKRLLDNVLSSNCLIANSFQSTKALVSLRTHKVPCTFVDHLIVDTGKQSTCVICCRFCASFWAKEDMHTIPNGEHRMALTQTTVEGHGKQASRKGCDTTHKCGTCSVSLCVKKRYKLWGVDLSCSEVWHSYSKLPLEHPILKPYMFQVSEASDQFTEDVVVEVTERSVFASVTTSASKRRRKSNSMRNSHGSDKDGPKVEDGKRCRH